MRMHVVWLIGAAGAVKPSDTLKGVTSIPAIYRIVPDQYRYAVGWEDIGELVVLDLYLTRLTSEKPFLEPHFVDRFTDIDHAVAALTIGYKQDHHTQLRRWSTIQSIILGEAMAKDVEDGLAQGVEGNESLAGLSPLLGRPGRR